MKLLRAVDVGAKADAVLLDRQHAPEPAAPDRRAALDLVGDRAVAHAEDLKAAGVGDDRRAPAHELVQAAEVLDELGARVEEEVKRVAEHHVVAERGDLARLEPLDGPLCRQRHERRRADLAVGGAQDPGARAASRGRDEGSAGRSCAPQTTS